MMNIKVFHTAPTELRNEWHSTISQHPDGSSALRGQFVGSNPGEIILIPQTRNYSPVPGTALWGSLAVNASRHYCCLVTTLTRPYGAVIAWQYRLCHTISRGAVWQQKFGS